MIQWKQRLYAFLLRRTLGPILHQESLRKLHDCIDVSLQEGSFELRNVSLNVDSVNELLAEYGVRVRSAEINKLQIQLTLKEHDNDIREPSSTDNINTTTSSLAWRAMQLGTSYTGHNSTSTVSLVATVQIDGLNIHIEPCAKQEPKQQETTKDDTDNVSTSATKSMVSSYMEAAISSLRLAVTLKNLRVRVVASNNRHNSRSSSSSSMSWLELRLQSAYYHDKMETVDSSSTTTTAPTTTTTATSSDYSYEMVLRKTVELTRITVMTGETTSKEGIDNASSTSSNSEGEDVNIKSIGLLDGTSHVTLLAVEYKTKNNDDNDDSVNKSASTRVQQDIEINMNQKLNVSVDAISLRHIRHVVQRFQHPLVESSQETEETENVTDDDSRIISVEERIDDETDDLSTIDGIMKQYQEARLLAEHNVVRGGILLPSVDSSDGDNSDKVTFDTFFDANDQGFSRYYSSVLKESLLGTSGSVADWVHTKLRFRLQEGGLKIAFGQDSELVKRRQSEYILLTFSEVNLSGSLAAGSSDLTFSIIHLELEDSLLVSNKDPASRGLNVEIGTLLRFSPQLDGNDSGSDDCDLLVEAPCLSVHVKTGSSGEEPTTETEITLEPVELLYRPATVTKLVELLRGADDDCMTSPARTVPTEKKDNEMKRISTTYASCSLITVSLPLLQEKDWSSLYARSGYFVNTSGTTTRSTLSFCFEHAVLECNRGSKRSHEEASVSCRNILMYASSPVETRTVDRSIRRFDIGALAGRTEVNPCIPISCVVTRCNGGDENPAIKAFPKVAPISSFKARQEDDDEDERIDRVLSSKLGNLRVDSRKELRGADPQTVMLNDVSQCDVSVSISIPELVGDLSSIELSVLNEMARCVLPGTSGTANAPPNDNITKQSKRVAVSVVCESVSLAVHGETTSTEGNDAHSLPNHFSFLLRIEQLIFHCLKDGSNLRHIRVLSHAFDLCEGSNIAVKRAGQDSACLGVRLRCLRERSECNANCVVVPIFYRSHLFSPISRDNPSLLLDFLNQSCENPDVPQRNIHVTLYDTTYRFDFDSCWHRRLHTLLPKNDGSNDEEADSVPENSGSSQSLTRVFLSVADCNVDYSSPERFQTASRAIVRFGDVRVSSNVMLPHPPVQAFSLSLGDVSLYLCNNRYPYSFEDSCLLGGQTPLLQDETSLRLLGLPVDAEPDDVQRAMNYRTMVTLDAVDAVVTMTNAVNDADGSVPAICSNLTIGQLSLFSCKDSFSVLTRTISEATTEITALTDEQLELLRSQSSKGSERDASYESRLEEVNEEIEATDNPSSPDDALDELKKRSALQTSGGSLFQQHYRPPEFLLDGYDWTAVDSDEFGRPVIPAGEEQVARWYGNTEKIAIESSGDDSYGHSNDATVSSTGMEEASEPKRALNIISHHFPLHPVSDPIADGDMGISSYIGSKTNPQIQSRILVHDLCVNLRFFDGYDWPELLDKETRKAPRGDAFLIPEVSTGAKVDGKNNGENTIEVPQKSDAKSKIMDDLLSGGSGQCSSTFKHIPLPEERGRMLIEEAELRRWSRCTNKFLHLLASRVSIRMDSLEESTEYNLASCMNLAIQDFFIAETISSNRPVKLIGEWFNEEEHPRDSKDGLLMMKMVTSHPPCRVSPANDIANEESEIGLKILPLRCIIDQRAVAFARAFFRADGDDEIPDKVDLPFGLHAVPPPLFTSFRVRPFKLKVDYKPQKLDSKALRDGSIVELINLSPLDSMVLTLQQVEIENEVGFGSAMSVFLRRLVQDICQTQLLKFVTNSRPLEPITQVSGAAADMVVLPWEAFRNGETIQRALRSGTKSFSKTLLYEFCSLTSRATEYIAGNVSRVSATNLEGVGGGEILPSRPLNTPRGVIDATPHAVESLSRGLQAANYKIVIVPYREYRRTGATSAAKSVLKGIPVAIAAPASGAAEALSFALLGVRNQVRPEIRKEEEESIRGLDMK